MTSSVDVTVVTELNKLFKSLESTVEDPGKRASIWDFHNLTAMAVGELEHAIERLEKLNQRNPRQVPLNYSIKRVHPIHYCSPIYFS